MRLLSKTKHETYDLFLLCSLDKDARKKSNILVIFFYLLFFIKIKRQTKFRELYILHNNLDNNIEDVDHFVFVVDNLNIEVDNIDSIFH